MSQNDFSIANQTFPTTRTDMNSALQALASLSSGASAPTTTYAYMWWADTTNGVLKQRDSADSAWVIRDTLSNDRVVTKTGAYTVALGDFGKLILADGTGGTFTITLPASATAGDGFRVAIKKIDGSNDITIDGDGSETIDGSTTLTLDSQYQSYVLECDGSNWHIKSFYENQVITGSSNFAGVYMSAGQNINTTTATLQFNTEDYDTGSDFNTSTYKYTCPSDGKYHVSVFTAVPNIPDNEAIILRIRINSTDIKYSYMRGHGAAAGSEETVHSDYVFNLSTNDTIEFRLQTQSNLTTGNGADDCYASIYKVS